MSNPLNLNITKLPGVLPRTPVISIFELAERQQCASACSEILDAAKKDAQALRTEAENVLEKAHQEAGVVLSQARHEAQRLRIQTEQETIASAVQWLCAEQDIERKIASELNHRWRALTAQVLQELLGQSDQKELLLRRVERKVAELLPVGRVTLFVAPQVQDDASQLWSEISGVIVRADPSLSEGQALLDNGLVRIHLNTQEYQHQLLAQLSETPERKQHA